MAKISVSKATSLVTSIYKGEKFNRDSVFDNQTYYRDVKTFVTNIKKTWHITESLRSVNPDLYRSIIKLVSKANNTF